MTIRSLAGKKCLVTGAASGIGLLTNSGRSLQRPDIAVPKTWAIATLMNEEATYGRSLT